MKYDTENILYCTYLLGIPLILSLMMYDNIDNIINSGFLIPSLFLILLTTFVPIYLVVLDIYTTYQINKNIKDRTNK